MKKNHVTLIVTATIAFTLAVFALTVWALVSKNDKKSDMKGNSSKPDVPSVSDPRDLILENDSELLDLKQLSREQLIDLLGERDEDGYRQLNSDFSKWDNMDYFAAANYCDIYKTETRTVIFEFADLRRSCTVEEQVDGDLQIRTIYNTRQFRCDIDPELSLSEEGNTALTGVLDELRSFRRGQSGVENIEALLGKATLQRGNILYYLDGWVVAWVNADGELIHLSSLEREPDRQMEKHSAITNCKTGELYWELPIF